MRGKEGRRQEEASAGGSHPDYRVLNRSAAGRKATVCKATERPRPRKAVAMGMMEGVVAREAATGISFWGRMSGMGRLSFFVEGVDWLKWLVLFSALTWFVLIVSRENTQQLL